MAGGLTRDHGICSRCTRPPPTPLIARIRVLNCCVFLTGAETLRVAAGSRVCASVGDAEVAGDLAYIVQKGKPLLALVK